ncbi:hypothetical protein ACXR2T_10260 [Leucobacter sp. HY1910]
MRKIRSLVAGLVLALIATVSVPALASAAAPVSSPATHAAVFVAADSCSNEPDCASTSDKLVTIKRWKDAASGFDANVGITDVGPMLELANRKVLQGQWISAGNMSFDWALSAVSWAGGSQEMYSGMAYAVDRVVAGILKAFTGVAAVPGAKGMNFLTLSMALAALIAFFQVVKQTRGAGAQMFKRVVVISFMMAYLGFTVSQMIGPAGPAAAASAAAYKPPAGTPSWIISKVNQGVDMVAGLPAAIAMEAMSNPMMVNGKYGGDLGCYNVTAGFEEKIAPEAKKPDNRGLMMEVMIDRTWQMTGLTTWIKAQFGSGNTIGNDVYCYLLDLRSSDLSYLQRMEATQIASNFVHKKGGMNFPGFMVSTQGGRLTAIHTGAKDLAIISPQSNEQKYAGITAHAACNWNGSSFEFRSGFKNGFNPNKGQDSSATSDKVRATGAGYKDGFTSEVDANKACSAAFTAKGEANFWKGSENGDASSEMLPASLSGAMPEPDYLAGFIMPGNQASIDYKVPGPRTKDFISSFYGTTASSATPIVFVYSILSWAAALPFIILSVGVIILRLVMVMMLIGLWVALIGAAFSTNPWEDKLKKPAMQVLTSAIMTTGLAGVLGLVLVISTSLTQVMREILGVSTVGSSGAVTMSILIACMSPTVTLIGMNIIWKKTFNAPSPMTLKGAQAWAKGAPLGMSALAAGAGGAIGAGLASRMGRQASGAAKTAGKRWIENRTDGMMGRDAGRSGRRSGMGGGSIGAKETMGKDSQFQQDLAEAKNQRLGSRAKGLGGKLAAGGAALGLAAKGAWPKLASGGKKLGGAAASGWRAAKANALLATTPEGRAMLARRAGERAKLMGAAVKRGGAMAWDGTKAMTSRAGERMLSSVGLDQATREQIAFEAQAHGHGGLRRAATLGMHAAGHVGGAAGRTVAQAASLAAKPVHSAVMAAAGPGASVGQAYARLGKQAAVVGASVAVPAALPAVLGAVALSNANRSVKSARTARAERQAARDEALVQGVRAQREAVQAAEQAAAEAAQRAEDQAQSQAGHAADANDTRSNRR